MKEYLYNQEVYLVFTADNQLMGLVDMGNGKKRTHAFTSLSGLQEFMQFQKDCGNINYKQYKAFPTTLDEYFNQGLCEKLGGMELVIDPPLDVVDTPEEIGMQGLN